MPLGVGQPLMLTQGPAWGNGGYVQQGGFGQYPINPIGGGYGAY
jgi:hypothetical protein